MEKSKIIIDMELIDSQLDSGAEELALVEAPAIEKLWVAFGAVEPETQSLEFAAVEDQQIIVGPVCVPDIEILRLNKDKSPYYIRFSAEVIQRMAEKFMKEKRVHDTNIAHVQAVDGKTYIFESWIVENLEDKANSVYNLNVPVGTWVVKARVTDPGVWSEVKAGKLKGWSLEGRFVDKKELDQYNEDKALYEKIMGLVKKI